jgi:hypothetical protein
MGKILLALLLLAGAAQAQQPPVPKLSTIASAAIAVTNTYQQALPLETGRMGCTIQNNGANPMFIVLDALGSATPPVSIVTALKLAAGQSLSCTLGGVVIADKIWIAGTAADVFVVTRQ